jgi:hypothetical protein
MNLRTLYVSKLAKCPLTCLADLVGDHITWRLPLFSYGAPVKRGVVPSGLTAHVPAGVLGGWILVEMLAD